MRLNCIVSGYKISLDVDSAFRVGQLILHALAATERPTDASSWEATDADGFSLVRSNTLTSSDLEEGDSVFIDPKPGVGA